MCIVIAAAFSLDDFVNRFGLLFFSYIGLDMRAKSTSLAHIGYAV